MAKHPWSSFFKQLTSWEDPCPLPPPSAHSPSLLAPLDSCQTKILFLWTLLMEIRAIRSVAIPVQGNSFLSQHIQAVSKTVLPVLEAAMLEVCVP